MRRETEFLKMEAERDIAWREHKKDTQARMAAAEQQ